MIPHWSDKHPDKHAKKVYNDAFWRFVVLGCLTLIPLPVAISILADWLGLPPWVNQMGGGAGVGVVILMGVAHHKGVRALRDAGLLREENEIIERAATISRGETVEFRKSIASKLGCVGFFLVLGIASWYLRVWQPHEAAYVWIGTAGAILCGVLVPLFLISLRRPVFRIDDEGIFVCADWIFPRFVSWESIASAQFYRVWGLPPAFLDAKNPADTILIKDSAGKTRLRLDFATFYEAPPETKAQFIAELKRRLRGDEAAPNSLAD